MEKIDNNFTKIELKYIKLFVKFLKKNNAYHIYIKNVSERRHDYIAFIKYLIRNDFLEDFFVCAFAWHSTEQGSYFWGKLNSEWQKFISKFK